jgi:hypothetical protein
MAREKSIQNVIESSSLRLEFDIKTREWTLYEKSTDGWSPAIRSGFIQLTLQDGRILRTDDQHASQKMTKKKSTDFIGKATCLVVRNSPSEVELEARFTLYNVIKAISIELQVRNKTREAIECKGLNLVMSSAPTNLLFREGQVCMQVNGDLSKSESDIIEVETDPLTSFWHTILYSPTKRESLLLGFLTDKVAVNSFEAQRSTANGREFDIKSISDLTALKIEPGKSMTSDRLLIQFFESPFENLENYSALCYKFSAGKKQAFLTGHSPRDHVPTGWSLERLEYADMTESEVIKNLEAAEPRLKAAGLHYILIGDGYQRVAGGWETNEKFPQGHRWLTDQIHRRGFLAGLWIAPFAVAEESGVYKEHQDWLLKGPDGSLKKVETNPKRGGANHVLDPTLPEVQRWLRKLFQRITHTWRYDCVQVDLLSCAALGPSYQKVATTAQAYQMGLQAIRDGVGSKKLLFATNALLGPSIGLVDGLRISEDVEESWKVVQTAAGAASHRYSYHNRAWFNDSDRLEVAEPVPLDQARARATLLALSGQINLMVDNLSTLPSERLELLSKTLPANDTGAVPIDLFDLRDEVGMSMRGPDGAVHRLSRLVRFRTGDDLNWKETAFDDSDWELVSIPQAWENYEGHDNYDGYGWYRLSFQLPTDWSASNLTFALGRIDDCDETFLNGTRIGSSGTMPPQYQTAWNLFRTYRIPKEVVNWKGENVLAIRAYDGGGQGGLYSLKRLHLSKIWNLLVKKKSEQWNVVGVFNWENSPQKINVPFEKLGLLPNQKYVVYESWGEELLGEFQDGVDLELQPTSSKLLSIHKEEGRPRVLSTSRHITQGAVDLKEIRWNGKKSTIEGKSVNLLRGDYALFVWIPAGYKYLKAITAVKYETSEILPSLLKITLKLGKDKPLTWKLQFERTSR